MTQTLISLTFIAYLALILFMGFFNSRRNRTVQDFYLGNRSLGPFVTAMSAEASDMSAWLLMGLPGLAYVTGIADAGWTAIGLLIGTIANWNIVALRLRRFSCTLDAITIPAFFSQRFADHKHRISALAGVIIIIFFIPYSTSAFVACGKLFSTVFAIEYTTAMVISSIILLFFTLWGGFLAASFTDVVQSVMMAFALFFVLNYALGEVGGLGTVVEQSGEISGFFSLLHSHNAATNGAEDFTLLHILSALSWGLGYFGMPHVLLRFMAVSDERMLPMSRIVAITWAIATLVFAVFIGITGAIMTQNGLLPTLEDPETIIIHVATLLAKNSVGYALLGGLVLAGILAATMSTADSQLLVASSAISQNLLLEFHGKSMSQKKEFLIARLSIVAISGVAMFMARSPDTSVYDMVSFSWAGFGASFGPVMLVSLFWRRANLQGAMAGMVAGAGMVFFWKSSLAPLGGFFAIYELLPAFLFSLLVTVLVTLATKLPNQEVELIFDASMMPVPPPRREQRY